MKNQLPVIARVKGLGQIVEVCTEYNVELEQLRDSGSRLISPRDEAYARLKTLKKEGVGIVYGTRTSAGLEYAKGQLPIFRVNSRLNNLKMAKKAVAANKRREFFHTNSAKEYEESLKEAKRDMKKPPKDRNVIVLPSRDAFIISDKQHWDIYETVLKDQAKAYFEYNGPLPIYTIDKETVDSQKGTIMTVLWFRSYEGQSILYGYSRNLNHDDRARGVFIESKKQQQSLATTKQFNHYLALLEKIKTGKAPLSQLQSVKDFLEKQKKRLN